MALFRGPIQKLSKEDIEKVLADQLPEDAELEFKREIEVDASGRVRDGSRNDVAREVVAFANADGGTILVGIEESSDEPKRAIAIKPLEKVHELAERLRR